LALQRLGQPQPPVCSAALQWHDRQSIIVGCRQQPRTATNNSCVLLPEEGWFLMKPQPLKSSNKYAEPTTILTNSPTAREGPVTG